MGSSGGSGAGGVRCSEVLVAGVSAIVCVCVANAAFAAQTGATGEYELKRHFYALRRGTRFTTRSNCVKVAREQPRTCNSASQGVKIEHVFLDAGFDWMLVSLR